MKNVTEQIEKWIADIECDLSRDWCEDKITPMLQLLKLQQARDLLKSVGQNNNIEID